MKFTRHIHSFITDYYFPFFYRFMYLGLPPHTTYNYSPHPDTNFLIRTRTADKFTLWEIWKQDTYLKPGINFPSARVIGDIGAKIGAFTVWASRLSPQAQILAYEPDPANFDLLVKNVALNHCSHIRAFPLAVGKDTKSRTFYTYPDSFNVGNSFYPADHTALSPITVPCTTLEEITRHNRLSQIDILKIDTEGAEYEILLHTPASTLAKINQIVLEFHTHLDTQSDFSHLEQFLTRHGFRVKKYWPLQDKIVFGVGSYFKSEKPSAGLNTRSGQGRQLRAGLTGE